MCDKNGHKFSLPIGSLHLDRKWVSIKKRTKNNKEKEDKSKSWFVEHLIKSKKEKSYGNIDK